MRWGSRATRLDGEANEKRDEGIAVVLMVVDSSSQRVVCEIHWFVVARILAAPLIAKLVGAKSVSKEYGIAANSS
jgi:hypothetical protein